MEGEDHRLPSFYEARIQRDLGELYRHLPAGAVMHDPNAYLKSEGHAPVVSLRGGRRARAGAAVMAPIPAAPN